MYMRQEKITNKEFYDRNATDWVDKRTNMDYCLDAFDEFKKLLPSGKMLDLGCGFGRDSSLFVPAGYDYTGIDLSDGMLVEANKKFPQTKFIKMDLCNLNFENNTFDGIWSFAAYLHIPKDEINQALSEANRVLKKDGIGFISIKKGSFESYLGEGEKRRYWAFYGKNQFAELLKNNGFEIIKSWYDKRDYNPPTDVSVFICYLIRKL